MHPQSSQNLFEQLDRAVSEVFDLMLARPCIPLSHAAPHALPGFTASVSFSGSLQGACALSLDLTSASELTEQLTGEPLAPGSALAADTVGELCNMIAGLWKSRLAPDLAGCQLSSPVVALAKPLEAAPITRMYHFAPHHFTLQLTLI